MLFLRRLLNRNMLLQAQLETLGACGILPRADFGTAELLELYRERQYETAPFRKLLMALGSATKNDAPLSDNVWYVRAGCISGPGDYVKVALRMSALTGGVLPITDVSDEFDLRRGVSWLRFRLRDRTLEWPARLQEQWLDPNILSRFVRLLAEQETDKRYTVLDLGGQDYLLGCLIPEQFQVLRSSTGLALEWLD